MASEESILAIINQNAKISTLEIATKLEIDHQQAVGIMRSIQAQAPENFIKVTQQEYKKLELTEEGKLILKEGSHEARIFNQVVKTPGLDQQTLLKSLPDQSMAKIGFSKAMSQGWIEIDKSTNKVKPKVDSINDEVQKLLNAIWVGESLSKQWITDLKRRKLITESLIKYLVIQKDENFALELSKQRADLTTELIQSGDWEKTTLKKYNFNSFGLDAKRGHIHPLLKVREQFRQIFLEMGFTEMPTNKYVESCFWNFDTLVVPQAHPARDSQDTFFISKPASCDPIQDKELVLRTRAAHEGSKDGSWPRGYQYEWDDEESRKLVLRTHTTAVSARMLYKLSQEYKKTNKLEPTKIFSIDRVFRNETLDATHLAEFNQVEGVCLGENLTLGNLMGVLEAFFKKLGMDRLIFKPAYNPYTEPSMEIFSFHPGLKKWVEVGNSGVFRPEMLSALGLPPSATAIAWGLSLERPTMIKYGINNIRELVGHQVNLQMVHESPLCLF